MDAPITHVLLGVKDDYTNYTKPDTSTQSGNRCNTKLHCKTLKIHKLQMLINEKANMWQCLDNARKAPKSLKKTSLIMSREYIKGTKKLKLSMKNWAGNTNLHSCLESRPRDTSGLPGGK